MVLGNLTWIWKKYEPLPLPQNIQKFTKKCYRIVNLNLKPKFLKFLEKCIRNNYLQPWDW